MADLRFALRILARTPGFTITVLLALAVGIGATTAIFSLINGVLLRPLPYGAPERLVMVWQDLTPRGGPIDEWGSPGNIRDWRQQREVFSSVSAISGWNAAIAFDGGTPEVFRGEQVTHDYFTTLGLEPALGRWFEAREDVPGAPRAVVLSHGFWMSRFGGDASVIGRRLTIGIEPHEVVGVAPAGTRGVVLEDAVVWRPIRLNLAQASYGSVFLRVIARLAPGVSVDAAKTRLRVVAGALQAQHPELKEHGIHIQRAQEWIVGDARLPLIVLMAAVLTLLALTIANIANLLLARASARERELSIRAAIGATRGRLVRLMILESVVLSLAGGLAGVLVARWMLAGLLSLVGPMLPRAAEVAVDARVLLFTGAVAALAGILFGLAPAAQSSRPDLQSPLRDGARGTSRRGHAVRSTLVVAQIALAMVMLVGAGLIVRSFAHLRHLDLGFQPEGVTTGSIPLGGAGYRTPEQVTSFLTRLEERLAAFPQASAAGFTSVLPLAAGGDSDMTFTIAGLPELQENGRPRGSWYRSVNAGYFQAMQLRMVRGRPIAPRAQEAVVNEAWAKRFLPGQDPIGRQIIADGPPLTIVGVVADPKTRGPRSAIVNEMYLPYQFMPEGTFAIVVRGTDPAVAIPAMREIVKAIDPKVPVGRLRTMEDIHSEALAQPRLLAVLLGAFASAALLLALLGIYGVIAYAVGQRTTEMGVRLALGATPGQVIAMVLRDGMKLAAIGLVIGLAGAFAAGGALGTLLYGVDTRDALTFGVAALAIISTALAASFLPARRASRVAPTEALRS